MSKKNRGRRQVDTINPNASQPSLMNENGAASAEPLAEGLEALKAYRAKAITQGYGPHIVELVDILIGPEEAEAEGEEGGEEGGGEEEGEGGESTDEPASTRVSMAPYSSGRNRGIGRG
jgi:hypothetical protein